MKLIPLAILNPLAIILSACLLNLFLILTVFATILFAWIAFDLSTPTSPLKI